MEKKKEKQKLIEGFSQLAKEINFKGNIDSDKDYDEMKEERFRKASAVEKRKLIK